MQSGEGAIRSRQVDDIAVALPERAAALTRLFLSRSQTRVSRTEIGVLRALAQRPQRITELAAVENVTQPAITLLVNRLEHRQWVSREPDPTDRRAVLVALTERGRLVFDGLLAEYRALLHEEMATLDDDDVATLARAIDVLDHLVERLQERER